MLRHAMLVNVTTAQHVIGFRLHTAVQTLQ